MYEQMSNAAGADDRVTCIPAQAGSSEQYQIGVTSFAGHVRVTDGPDDTANYLYYWFFESRTPSDTGSVGDTPLVIWLNGGPGASSLAGLFLENGPCLMGDDGRVAGNPNGWNERVHLLYWDQPVGTGFAYTTAGDAGYVTNEDQLSEQFYDGLQEFYARHPEYRRCRLYLTGESYAGKYVPFIAKKITEKNARQPAELRMNLAGLGIGDGWMKPSLQTQLQVDYGFQMGFVDTRQRELADRLYGEFRAVLDRGDMATAFQLGNNVTNMVLTCGGNPDIYDVRRWHDLSIEKLKAYLQSADVKSALHVPAEVSWQFSDASSIVADKLIDDLMADMTAILPKLIEAYRVLMYTGNFDMSCGFLGTEQILRSLDWPQRTAWQSLNRTVWLDRDAQVMGYVKSLGSLTQVVIPDAGHMVPVDKPAISRAMLNTWIERGNFDGYVPVVVQAREAWQDSGVSLPANVKLRIEAMTGVWTANPATGFVDAGGNPRYIAKSGYTLPGAREGALCGRVGPTGSVFLVGNGLEFSTAEAGQLYFCINDDLEGSYGAGLRDNQGMVLAAVTLPA